jgi:hypothetical protein
VVREGSNQFKQFNHFRFIDNVADPTFRRPPIAVHDVMPYLNRPVKRG